MVLLGLSSANTENCYKKYNLQFINGTTLFYADSS